VSGRNTPRMEPRTVQVTIVASAEHCSRMRCLYYDCGSCWLTPTLGAGGVLECSPLAYAKGHVDRQRVRTDACLAAEAKAKGGKP